MQNVFRRRSRMVAFATIALLLVASIAVLWTQPWRTASYVPTTLHHSGDATLLPQRPAAHSVDRAGNDRFSAAFERGIAAYNADDAESALDAFEEAVRLDPDNPEARINLGLVYMRLQRPEDGLRELAAGARLQRERTDNTAARPPSPGKRADTIRE